MNVRVLVSLTPLFPSNSPIHSKLGAAAVELTLKIDCCELWQLADYTMTLTCSVVGIPVSELLTIRTDGCVCAIHLLVCKPLTLLSWCKRIRVHIPLYEFPLVAARPTAKDSNRVCCCRLVQKDLGLRHCRRFRYFYFQRPCM